MNIIKKKISFGLIIGSRGIFNPELAREGRKQLLKKLDSLDCSYTILSEDQTPNGAIETLADAQKCARLFREKREQIDGVIVVLPNFGDELGIVQTLDLAKLNVPVLVQACNDRPGRGARSTIAKVKPAFMSRTPPWRPTQPQQWPGSFRALREGDREADHDGVPPRLRMAVPQSTSSHRASLPATRCGVNSRDRPPGGPELPPKTRLTGHGESDTKSHAGVSACQPPESSGPSPAGPPSPPPISTRTNLRFPLCTTCVPGER